MTEKQKAICAAASSVGSISTVATLGVPDSGALEPIGGIATATGCISPIHTIHGAGMATVLTLTVLTIIVAVPIVLGGAVYELYKWVQRLSCLP